MASPFQHAFLAVKDNKLRSFDRCKKVAVHIELESPTAEKKIKLAFNSNIQHKDFSVMILSTKICKKWHCTQDINCYTLFIFPFSLSQLIFLLTMNSATGRVGDYVSNLLSF